MTRPQSGVLRWVPALAAVLAVVLGLVAAGAEGPPRIRFDSSAHDFGDLRSDEKVSHDWAFHNDGGQPLEILRTRTSCGCTMSVVDDKVIPPGGRGVIRVDFNPAGMEGSVRRSLAVTSNDPANSVVRLTVRARVTPTDIPQARAGHPPIAGQSLLMGECGSCHAEPARGKSGAELYEAVCAMCHGPDATGALAPSLRHPSYLDERSDAELHEGVAYGTANPRMPGFSELMGGPLSDEQIRSLVALLREWGSTTASR